MPSGAAAQIVTQLLHTAASQFWVGPRRRVSAARTPGPSVGGVVRPLAAVPVAQALLATWVGVPVRRGAAACARGCGWGCDLRLRCCRGRRGWRRATHGRWSATAAERTGARGRVRHAEAGRALGEDAAGQD